VVSAADPLRSLIIIIIIIIIIHEALGSVVVKALC
jgi:hypothetical protein